MRGIPTNFVLAGIVLALLLKMPGDAFGGPAKDEAAIEAAISVPEPANLPPPSIADIGVVAPPTIPGSGEYRTAQAPRKYQCPLSFGVRKSRNN